MPRTHKCICTLSPDSQCREVSIPTANIGGPEERLDLRYESGRGMADLQGPSRLAVLALCSTGCVRSVHGISFGRAHGSKSIYPRASPACRIAGNSRCGGNS